MKRENKVFERPLINGKKRNIRKEGLSIKSVANAAGKSVDSVLAMIN